MTCTWWAAASGTLILGRTAALDLDFATDARPEDVQTDPAAVGGCVVGHRDSFGTSVRPRASDRVEITTYRSDATTRCRATPRWQFGSTIDGDLLRRDFTANAMAVRITADGPAEFVDPLGGLAAIRRRVLDTPAAPEVSFGDDPLRMLRAARFISQLGFSVAPRVRAAIEKMAPQLGRITAERVAAELDKLILGDDPVAGIEVMVDTGMGDVVLPEVGAMRLAIDEHHQHKDVYRHSLTVLRQAIGLEDEGPGPGAAVGGAAARHRQAGHPQARAGRRGELSSPRGRRSEDGAQAAAGAEVLQPDGR